MKGVVLRGQAVPFGRPTEINLGGGLSFTEEFVQGSTLRALALKETLAAYGHDLATQPPLGSLRSGTLEAWETSAGLQFQLHLGSTSRAKDVAEAVARGDLGGVSVGFSVARDEWSARGGGEHRRVLEVGRLLELSFVPFPAYTATSVGIGSGERSGSTSTLDRRLAAALAQGPPGGDLGQALGQALGRRLLAARVDAALHGQAAVAPRRGLVTPGGLERRSFALSLAVAAA